MMPRPSFTPAPRRAFQPRRITRRAVVLGLFLTAVLALPTTAQALAAPRFSAPAGAASAPRPAPSPVVNPAPGPVPTPAPAPSPNPTPGAGSGPGSGSNGGGPGPSPGGGSGRLPAPQPMPSPPGSSSSGPSWWDIPGQVEHAIDQWFGDLVKAALNPIMNLIGKTVLSNPDTTGGRTGQLWSAALVIANTLYVLFAVVGGVIVMTHETVQTRYALGQIAPRLVLGLIAANTSLLVIGKAIALSNALTRAVWGQPLDPAGIGNALLGHILDSIFLPDGVTQIFLVLFGLVLAVLAGAVLFSAALRTAALMLLTFAAPLALSCHALPGLDAVARLWWRALAAVFAIQILQALTLILALQTFFDPNGSVLGVPTSAGFTDLLVCGALFVILLKIPGWVLRVALGRQPRSTVSGILKTAAAAAVGTALGVPGAGSARMLAGRLAGRALRSRLGPGGGSGGLGRGAIRPGPRPPRGPRPTPPRSGTSAAGRTRRPNFGGARGRPGPGGQLPLFPLPPGTRTTPAGTTPGAAGSAAATSAAGSGGSLSGGAVPSPMPGWIQPALFPAAPSGPVGRGRQLPLFPLPPGARRTGNTAPAPPPSPPTSGPGWRQQALFPPSGRVPESPPPVGSVRARQQPLFRLPAERRVAPAPIPAPPPAPRGPAASVYRQLPLFPRHLPAPPATPPAAAPLMPGAPRAQTPPPPVPRTVPVRLPGPAPAAMKAAKKPATRTRRKGGD